MLIVLSSLLVIYKLTNIISYVGELNGRNEQENGQWGTQKILVEKKQGRRLKKCHLSISVSTPCSKEEL